MITVLDGSNIIKPGARTLCLKKVEGVLIFWNANKEERNKVKTVSAQQLLKTTWNPKIHSEGAWGLDVISKE